MVYFWLGRNSSTQEQAAAAMLANNMHQTELKGRSTLVRAVPPPSTPLDLH